MFFKYYRYVKEYASITFSEKLLCFAKNRFDMIKIRYCSLLLILLCVFVSTTLAQDLSVADLPKADSEVVVKQKIKSLRTLKDSILKLEEERNQIQLELGEDSAKGREDELRSEVETLSTRINSLQADFTELFTGVKKDDTASDDEQKERDIVSQISELLQPIIAELKDLTSRPRRIDAIRKELAIVTDDKQRLLRGLSQAKTIRKRTGDVVLAESFDDVITSWETDLQIKQTKEGVLREKLDALLSEQKGFLATASDVANLFFKSRGRNLLLALCSALLMWFVCSRIRRRFESKWAEKKYDFKKRFVIVCFDTLAVLGSFLLFLCMLFALGDWVLVVLTVSLALAIVWGLKYAIPMYWGQTVLLLNMGAVRENERVLYRGISWRVKRLHFRSTLENPALSDGTLKLPIKDLLEMRSWPDTGVEPWFPSHIGDWVLVSDGVFGKVITQSLESVVVLREGGVKKFYTMQEFLESSPSNLSSGFRVSATIGLDYELRKKATADIPKRLSDGVLRKIEVRGYKHCRISVELSALADSAIEFTILLDVAGEYAKDYNKLRRLLQHCALEVCNEQRWGIPFPQVQLHYDSQASA